MSNFTSKLNAMRGPLADLTPSTDPTMLSRSGDVVLATPATVAATAKAGLMVGGMVGSAVVAYYAEEAAEG